MFEINIFYVEVNNGQLRIEPYEYFDRDAIFICSADVLRKISDGKLDPILAFTTQRLKVEGNFDKALRFHHTILKKASVCCLLMSEPTDRARANT